MISKDDCVSVLTHSDNDGDHYTFSMHWEKYWDSTMFKTEVYNKQHKNTTCVCHEYVM